MRNKMEKNNWKNIWMGNLAMGAWEDRERKYCNVETNCKHFRGYGKLPMGDVYTCHGFF